MGTYADWYRREVAHIGKPVEAALSAEEWADQRARADGGEARIDDDGALRAEGAFGIGERRAVAALSLHGAPFGFTWQDVDFIRATVLADDLHSLDDWFILQRIGDRIAALLPPRDAADADAERGT